MTATTVAPAPRKVSLLLGVGIFFLPIVFVWWLLRTGHSALARVLGFGWLALTLILVAANPDRETPTTSAPTSTPQTAVAPTSPPATKEEAPKPPASKWYYSSDTDEMRGTTASHASIKSENELNFGFPYDGGQAELTLRRRPEDGLSVILQVEGQFLCSSYSDDTVAVKFDDKPIQKYRCADPSDSSTGVLFIRNEARFIENLRAAKKVIIEAEFFQEGRRQMTFDVTGLEWPPKS